jgi:hypothetical protein
MAERVTWKMVEKRAGYIGKMLGAGSTIVDRGSASYRYETLIRFQFDDVAGDTAQLRVRFSPAECLNMLEGVESGIRLLADSIKAGHVS